MLLWNGFWKNPPVKNKNREVHEITRLQCNATNVWFPLRQRCSFSLEKSLEAWSVPLHRPSFLQRVLPFFLLNLCNNISPSTVGPYPHAQICRCHLNSPPSRMQATQLAKKYFIWALLRQCNCARFLLGYQRLIRRCVQAPASLGIFRVPCSTRGS